ncbi:MAG: DUF4173 domain-containing protein [Oscillospiraceae bacterium]|jgi:hypothetical protein|nr:DUF4173 domain-containing protein [Oscillospiraceae bacterium]
MRNDSAASVTRAERNRPAYLLPLIALALGILFDRLVINGFAAVDGNVLIARADRMICAFWFCCLGIVIWMGACGGKRSDAAFWVGTAGCAALIAWFFINNTDQGNYEFSFFARVAIPLVLMTLSQYAASSFTLKDAGMIFAAFLSGWFVQPFSGIKALSGVFGKIKIREQNPAVRNGLIGLLIALPMLAIILPLLSGADQMFGYYISQLSLGFHPSKILLHGFAILFAAVLFFSFLWNLNNGVGQGISARRQTRLDTEIWGVALIIIMAVYAFFCSIQFAHLFARSGLPSGFTYAEYAREGFAQTVIVCAINMILFGACMRFSQRGRFLSVLLAILLALTAVMLFSGFIRLKLYIDAFGMTWLRLVSGWFIIYLAVVLILSCARLFLEKIPLIGVCAVLLLIWFAALGFANPDMFIENFNIAAQRGAMQLK